MAKEMLINVSEGEECRIALLKDGRLDELYMERTSSTSHVGNIYKGRVTNVEPSIQAAFVDFGLGRNGFLHISDLLPSYFGHSGEDIQESVGRKMARRDRPPIQRCLRRGDEIVVQIIKEGIGTKGPTLTTYLSIPGRFIVMMPGMGKMGISKKIEDEVERRRLRQILDSLKPPKDLGFIIRTAGVGKAKMEIQRDLTYLTRLWQNIEKKMASGSGPMELYTEGDLVTRTVRDVFTAEVERIVVDNKEVARRTKEFIKLAMPRTKNKVDLYEEAVPLFHKYGIEKEIEQMYSRHVPLPSGGSLVIDSTEAVVAIDVNSGKFRDHNDAEMTAYKTDMEAADEIPRQLKLRDLGGVIICDFIDLRYERHRRDLEKRLYENFKDDRAKTKVLNMSQFGIIELTRQRMRPSLKRSIYSDCPYCKGAGLVKTPESMSIDVMRRLAIAANDQRVQRIELVVCPDVAFYLNNRKRQQLAALESGSSKQILIKSEHTLGLDEMRLELFDSRDGLVTIEGLLPVSMMHQASPANGRPSQQQQGRGGRRDDRRGQKQRPGQKPQSPSRDMEDREDEETRELDIAEQEVEDREEDVDQEVSAPVGRAEFEKPLPKVANNLPSAAVATAPEENFGSNDVEESKPVLPQRNVQGNPPAGVNQPGEGHRRRRGRRGRGRSGQGQGQDQNNQASQNVPQQDHAPVQNRPQVQPQDMNRSQGQPQDRNRPQGQPQDRNRPQMQPQDRNRQQGQPQDRNRQQGQPQNRQQNQPQDRNRPQGQPQDRNRQQQGQPQRDRNRQGQPQDRNRPQRPFNDRNRQQNQDRNRRPDPDGNRIRPDQAPRSNQEEVIRRLPPSVWIEVPAPAPTPVQTPAPTAPVIAEPQLFEAPKPVETAAPVEAPKPVEAAVPVTAKATKAVKATKTTKAKTTRTKKTASTEKSASTAAPKRARATRTRVKPASASPAVAPVQLAPIAEAVPSVRPLSTDRHLIADEPIIPEPVRRPRTYRDLDHIPDDLD